MRAFWGFVAVVAVVGGAAQVGHASESREVIAKRFVEKWAWALSLAAYPWGFGEKAVSWKDDSTALVRIPDTKIELTLTFNPSGLIGMSVKSDVETFAVAEDLRNLAKQLVIKEQVEDGWLDKLSKKLIGLAFDQITGADVGTVALNVFWAFEGQNTFLGGAAPVADQRPGTPEPTPDSVSPSKGFSKGKKGKRPRPVVQPNEQLASEDVVPPIRPSTPAPNPDDEPARPSASGDYCYAGAHPIGDRWEAATGEHRHVEPPFDLYLFAYHEGCYHFIGDAARFGYVGQVYGYFGEHPLWDGRWCFNDGAHTHNWQPSGGDYKVAGNWYYWAGTYDAAFLTRHRQHVAYYADYYPAHYVGFRSGAAPVVLANPTWVPPGQRSVPPTPIGNPPTYSPPPSAAAQWRGQPPNGRAVAAPAPAWSAPPPPMQQQRAPAPGWPGAQQAAQHPAIRQQATPMQAPVGGVRAFQPPMQRPAPVSGWGSHPAPMQAPAGPVRATQAPMQQLGVAPGWRTGQPASQAPQPWNPRPPVQRAPAPMMRGAPMPAPSQVVPRTRTVAPPAPPRAVPARPAPAPRQAPTFVR